ncbi:peptidoglycan-binding protein [Trichocoleus desertorum AS-A10]|uniref:peptidoglycan-binding domain-containing protein n=1 Tax=Trichocoleus desertorum TaxID=1481672 RepID=UPI00329A1143
MENLAYLHLVSSYEAPPRVELFPAAKTLELFSDLNWAKLSSGFLIRLLTVIAGLAVLTLADHVLALPLQREDEGPEVEVLQRCLVEQNYLDTSTFGYFGSKTEAAVVQFQQDSGLTADGVVGSTTARALNCAQLSSSSVSATSYYSSEPSNFGSEFYNSAVDQATVSLGDRGATVEDLQRRLNTLGYYFEPIDGVFGPATEQAVIQFQRDRNLTGDGVVGSGTWASLGRSSSFDTARSPNSGLGQGGYLGENARPAQKFSVLELQRRLKARGFYPGALDGSMGPTTQRAIAAAQRFYGVSDRDVRNGRF